MELRSIAGVERVLKANLTQVNKTDILSEHNNKALKDKMEVNNDDVLSEIAKTLSKHPPVKNEEHEPIDLEKLKDDIENATYKPNLESLAEKLIDLL